MKYGDRTIYMHFVFFDRNSNSNTFLYDDDIWLKIKSWLCDLVLQDKLTSHELKTILTYMEIIRPGTEMFELVDRGFVKIIYRYEKKE